jgi:hypothetical protein
MMQNHSESTPPPPEVQLFIREDVSRPENRTNLALLSVLMVPAFRHWFLGRLGLAPDSVVYPPQNQGGRRPDFVVLGPDGRVRAWIEVELAGENANQLAGYRNLYSEPIKSITGPPDAASDVSLEELAEIASDCLTEVLDKQQRRNVQIFVELVRELGGRASAWDYTEPGEAIRQEPFITALQSRLGGALRFGKPPIRPGQLQISTITQKGWTLRAHARNASFGSVSVLWNQGGRALRVPSQEQLAKYLRVEAVGEYRSFFNDRFSLDIGQLAGQRASRLTARG